MTTTAAPSSGARDERVALGKHARKAVPLDSHAGVDVAPGRDTVGMLLEQATSRVQELVPLRHTRMLASPFTFFRGAALPMAADLSRAPSSGMLVQLCGDAHLSNFGAYASPERNLVFDLNDFDETLPGPFEWDVKRLAASFAVAGRANGFSDRERRDIVVSTVAAYREAMRSFARMPNLTVWYAHLDVDDALRDYRDRLEGRRYKDTKAMLAKARKRDSTQALHKLTEVVDGRRRIVADPPLVVPVEDLFPEESHQVYEQIVGLIDDYARTLQPNRRHLLHQFRLVQLARKVVGVGSVGTRAWILLLEADGGEEHLFLQAKEAQASVLAGYAGASALTNEGERVVTGQHLMQAVSDIFLGWQRTTGVDGVDRDYYLRQLRDWKLSAPVEEMIPSGMAAYGGLCAWTLARAHARSGDRIAIAAYLGKSDSFERALTEFAESYADLTERDHASLAEAVRTGRAEAAVDE